MRLRFRTRQLLGFVLVVAVMGLVTTWAGFSFLTKTIVQEARLRVEMDLNSAWSAYREELAELESAVALSIQRESISSSISLPHPSVTFNAELDEVRRRSNLDFLTIIRTDRVVVARSRSPFTTGDTATADAVVRAALEGKGRSGTVLMPASDLRREGEGLAELAYVPLIETERATPSSRLVEDRGLVLKAAVPLLDAQDQVMGVIYGGILLNRKFELVDRIRSAVFGDVTYDEKPVGTVTIFLGDVRIATNVIQLDRTRALGTRVSEEVYQTVLKRGKRFADRAFVVNDWYLSAYDPIFDADGQVVGIIYVGLLEKKYLSYGSGLGMRFLGISIASLLLSAVVAFYLSNTLRRPISQLVTATRSLAAGQLATRVKLKGGSQETFELATAFNSMAEALERRSSELEQVSIEVNHAYHEAADKNRAYLEMLGFVTHELKSPLASVVFAIESVREGILGPTTRDQDAVLKSAANSADYLRFTIANYLNLGRIEEGALRPELTEVTFVHDVIQPVIDRLTEMASDRQMNIRCEVSNDSRGLCDQGLLTVVFQNLLSNAIKYGQSGGQIVVSATRNNEGHTFSVWNEGPGFAPEIGKQLFTKFFRSPGSGQDTKSGTGLGLFVTRRIVELHGGTIWAESEEKKWARFSFTLPVGKLD